ncbi:MAG: RHS repeat-associated core domain-containing protein [Bacteroidales bacterium]|nr:RHS repeat-associated core domain-containing protein [Bacteroidales bacterium]
MSNSWITECSGKTVQHLQYLPYGERYVDQRVSGYHERFTFTGKERDEETGYGYFGARYMDHELMTMWLSVDPLADKYPSISPYAYCAWNPIKLVDPDGRQFDSVSNIHVQRFETFTNKQISLLEGKQQRTDEENAKLAEYKSAMKEVSEMRNDNKTLYKITTNASFDDPTTSGYTEYGGKSDNMDVINISIQGDESSRKGLIQMSHELKHAHQFYAGDVIYAEDKTGKTYMNNSRPLEVEAYNRSKAYGGAPMNPNDAYIQSLSPTKVSLKQMKQQYPNCNYVYRKNK